MNTKTYIDKLVRECVRERKEEILKEAIRPIVAQTLYEFRVDGGSNNGKGKASASALVRKLMKNPNFKKAAQSYLEKTEGPGKNDYDGWTNNEKTYTTLDQMPDGSKRRIVTQRLADKKMDWAPMAYRLWPDMTRRVHGSRKKSLARVARNSAMMRFPSCSICSTTKSKQNTYSWNIEKGPCTRAFSFP